MWKISYFPDSFFREEKLFEANLAFLAELGVEYVELREIDRKNIMSMDNDEIAAAKKTVAKYGLKVGGLGTPIFKCPLRGYGEPIWGDKHGHKFEKKSGGSAYQDHLKLLERAFEISDMLDPVNIRCFGFWRQYKLDEVFDEVIEKLQTASRMAEASGHKLAIENEHNTIVGTGVELARVLKAVGKPFTGIYDIGNSWRRGGVPYPTDMDALKGGLISHVHVKHESVDVLTGCTEHHSSWGDPIWKEDVTERDLGGFCLTQFGSWTRQNPAISGKVIIDGQEMDIIGGITSVPVTKVFHIDHPAIFRALRADGYEGIIAVDNGFHGPQARINVKATALGLKELIKEVWA